ncbi:MAG: site-specific integrase [Clostridia bacterium]|nr:site-specific integrase [Clostridia bacterium]
MNELKAYQAQEIEATSTAITGNLFSDFVAWIDRSDKTARTYITNLRQFAYWMQETGTTQPTRADIVAYRNDLTARGLKPNTVTAYLRVVKEFFCWTAAQGLYPNIAATVRAPKVDHSTHKKDALTPHEVQEVEQSIDATAQAKTEAAAAALKDTAGRVQRSEEQGKRLRAIYLLAVNAGLRTVEISRANVKDLETKGGQAWLYIWGKGHTEPDQKKALAPEVAAAVKEYLACRSDRPTGNSPLFVSTGNRSGGQRIASTTISTMLKRAMQEAGYNSERLTAHSLRHTAGTNVQQLTGDIYQTQKYMRHANPATTEIYLHNETEQQEAAIAQQLYNLYHGQQETDGMTQLENMLQRLNPAQIAQLAGIAQAMA